MDTYKILMDRIRRTIAIAAAAAIAGVSTVALADGAAGETRLSVTTQNTQVQRENGIAGPVSEDEFDVLVTEGGRDTKSKRSTAQAKATQQTAQSANVDFWFYSVDVVLFNDHDRDGYYHGIDLLFDADTYLVFADVYAVVYLSYEGGPWNEYAVTEDFTIFGASSEDEYVVVTELVSGYPSGSYDILIELFDAYDGSFLAWIGPEDTSELAFLPLEDANRDVADTTDVIVVNRRGGGSLGWLLILGLGLTALLRARRGRRA